VSDSLAFIRLLRHVCLATLRAVITPSVIAFSVVYSFAPACSALLDCAQLLLYYLPCSCLLC